MMGSMLVKVEMFRRAFWVLDECRRTYDIERIEEHLRAWVRGEAVTAGWELLGEPAVTWSQSTLGHWDVGVAVRVVPASPVTSGRET